jgi:hypothetical protein
VTQPRLELLLVERRQAEVVEQVLAHLQLAELRARDEQQHRLERAVALAQRAADPQRALGVVVGAHDRARPAVGGLRLRGHRRVRDRLPRVAGEVERLREERRRRVREHQERFRGPDARRGRRHNDPR